MTARRGSMRHSIRLRCPAEKVWDLVGAPVRLPEWWEGSSPVSSRGTNGRS